MAVEADISRGRVRKMLDAFALLKKLAASNRAGALRCDADDLPQGDKLTADFDGKAGKMQ